MLSPHHHTYVLSKISSKENGIDLIVGRVEPELALEDLFRLPETLKTPEAQPVAVKAAQVRPVIHQAPRQHPIEGGRQEP